MSAQCDLALRRPEAPPLARRNAAALADVVDYVSDRLGELGASLHEPWFSAQAGRLQLQGDSVEAEVGPFLLRSQSTPLFAANAPEQVSAWTSDINVRTRSGLSVSTEALTRLQGTDHAVIALDRLCRVLHMLNHLLKSREAFDLWVPLGLRHLLAVDAGHGAFFEEVLQRCGLGADRIVLQVALAGVGDADWAHVQRAFATYRERGFRLACALDAPPDETFLAHLPGLSPDWIRGRREHVIALRHDVPGVGLCLELAHGTPAPGADVVGCRDLLRLSPGGNPAFLL